MNCHCKRKKKRKLFHPLIPGVLLAILPKCPLCVMAYASSIGIWKVQSNLLESERMCSDGALAGVKQEFSHWPILLCLFFLILLLISLKRNYHGIKTQIAITVVLIGAGMILYSFWTQSTGLIPYGTALCISGAMINTFLPNVLMRSRLTKTAELGFD